jgi:hypothetical protein
LPRHPSAEGFLAKGGGLRPPYPLRRGGIPTWAGIGGRVTSATKPSPTENLAVSRISWIVLGHDWFDVHFDLRSKVFRPSAEGLKILVHSLRSVFRLQSQLSQE